MNDPAQPDQRLSRRDEVAPHITLPDPDKRRFPVGAVLIVAWIAVFLTIFIVLAQLKLKGPTPQAPGTPTPPPSSAPSGD
ncbi:MAG: hypothetical protein ACFHWZ_04280 [Phycisphaerales bacterium]|nr:hypothetical protein [bacterium]